MGNLTIRLRGTAYSYYRSCSPEQQIKYGLLVAKPTNRFTPVHLQAIQSGLFHECHQKTGEPVEYAQELRKLFARAYPNGVRGGPETKSIGQLVLANQFVSGLRADLKVKVIGSEGTMEQLLARARFEEAKARDLAKNSPRKHLTSPSVQKGTLPKSKGELGSSKSKTDPKCFNCELSGHLIRACPYPKQPKNGGEAHGTRTGGRC